MSFENFKESLSALFGFEGDFSDDLVAVVYACLTEKNVCWLCKNAALDLSAGTLKVSCHSFFIGLKTFDNRVHAGDRHCEA